jgi:hypothetical protein
MKEITAALKGEAGLALLRSAAQSYATLTIKSRLDGTKMWNAPWFVPGQPEDFHRWMKRIERERISYRDVLRSTGLDLPEVPQMVWPIEQHAARDGKLYPVYSGPRVVAASKAWADAFLAPLLAKEVA